MRACCRSSISSVRSCWRLISYAPVNSTPKIALVAGATGMVGSLLINTLLEAPDYARVYALTRRPLGREHPRLANRVVIWDRMEQQLKGLVAQDAFCCIGTTIREAGTQEAFREVDLEAVVVFAQAARAAQASRFIVVSSVAADARSKKFYLRTKGEMEEAITAVGFPSVDILQPSLLLGPRKQFRFAEFAGQLLAPLVNPMLTGKREPLRAIPGEVVARAMLGAARRGARGVYRYTHAAIRQLAEIRAPQSMAAQSPKKTSA
jgi:uncharacterized protein YbjT (DUF2867 family)